ncbi:hypothetical protein ONS95_015030 [Cadophora gregata]|uniref:uncharacterized protein n=1 Tax=Cadophora gregata TaxID=51156 RepID=UPI0026DD23EC|nr:uncharacterized protein ONS95_015030 [Cadophora gregata]KAK0105980.1 hypothetical protein ONS95_015030 [Cadophora gregata]
MIIWLAESLTKGMSLFSRCAPLLDLYLTTSSKNTNSYCRQQIMCGVGVVVYTAVKDSGCVLANTRGDQGLSTWVVLNEIGDIMNNTSNCNKSTTVLGFGLVIIPVNNWQLLKRSTLVESLLLLIKLLLYLLKTALLDLVLLELLEIIGEAELLLDLDRLLRWVILILFDRIAVI